MMVVDCLSSKVLLHVMGEDGAKDETRLGPDAGSEGGVNMFHRLVLIAAGAGARALGPTISMGLFRLAEDDEAEAVMAKNYDRWLRPRENG